MKHKIPEWLFLFVFLIITSAPLLGPFPPPEQFWDRESANLSGGLNVLKAAIKLPASFDAYFNDHYLLHDWHVNLYRAGMYHIFKETRFTNVLIGQEGWLYYTGEGNIRDYQCVSPFSDQELQLIRDRLLRVNHLLSAEGILFVFVIAPNKESIYPEYLPQELDPIGDICRIDQVLSLFEEEDGFVLLDLRDRILKEKQKGQVYHRTDTHWNDLGALSVTIEILDTLQPSFPNLSSPHLDQYSPEIRSFQGDLVQFLPVSERWKEEEIVLVPDLPSSAIFSEPGKGILSSEIKESTLPSAVVFRDSFMDAVIPFLSEHFSKVTYQRSFAIDFQIIEEERPDIVIYEVAQRYLYMLLEDWNNMLLSGE